MRGKRVSSHNWNPAACSAKTEFDNIVIIDVDSDTCENVVVLDVPESVKQRLRGSRRRSERIIPFHDVISIDDDDEDADLPGPSGAAGGSDGLDRDSIPSQRNSVDSDADVDDCCVVPDRRSTSESSDFDNHQSGEHNTGRRFGLGPDLEEDAFGNYLSDCEGMGDSSSDIRQQWEEAFLKRKHDRSDGQFGLGDDARGSTIPRDGGINKDAHFPGGSMSSSPENASMSDNYLRDFFRMHNVFDQHLSGADPGQSSKEKLCPGERFESSHDATGTADRDSHSVDNENPNCNGEYLKKNQGPQESFSAFDQLKVDKESDHATTCFNDEDQCHRSDTCSNDLNQEENVDGKESAPGNSHLDEPEGAISEEADAPTNSSVVHSVEQTSLKWPDNDVLHEKQSIDVDELPKKSAEQMKEEVSVNEATFIAQRCGERYSSDCQDTSTAPSINEDFINGREKLKESSEYKRAIEEELASRQLQIRLQAEEAQRLRRKKRAETLRKEDMERRQKQRLDEIRETQKKDVETMNIREQLRAEVRRELSMLEVKCFDMASLLRGLGIHVPGQAPLSKEVHAAYKKALLKFHPDRASTKDIRQQVEAEEKFKLISRTKEKFPFV
ncbi:hypothetical protein MLD38_004355 [Melastoma candidum]|uniref:Uncharacterized protein n=1 Tax=Melastoma candidum TaxID=119954 RepID=A0ACB9S6Y5_9MYRT|nr:hypothetical protein MLD38_004355 [Melastoma candidum]